MANESAVKGFTGTWQEPFMFAQFVFRPQLTDYFTLWGKLTKWEKTPMNWILLIVCFGWIWMAF
jgi:hypothetical protein